jgi:hypothetical protein
MLLPKTIGRDKLQRLAKKLMVACELGESFVEAHNVARQPHALGAERSADESEGRLALG